MSYWYEPKIEDIEVTEDGKELHVYLDSDEEGNNYVSLNVEELIVLLNQIQTNDKAPE